jgi:hypothetical protein
MRFLIERRPVAQLAAGFFLRLTQDVVKHAKFMICLDFGVLIS